MTGSIDWTKYIGRTLKIFCAHSIVYSGKVLSVDENMKVLLIRDRYNQEVFIGFSTINQIQVIQ